MFVSRAEAIEFVRVAVEALGRYRLRTALSVLGVVLGVAAVVAMMSVGEGAAREALAEVEALGLDNLVARSTGGASASGIVGRGLTADAADRAAALVPGVEAASPLVLRYTRVSRGAESMTAPVLGVRHGYGSILRMSMASGRWLAVTDEASLSRACVIGAHVARRLFGYGSALGGHVRILDEVYTVVGVLGERGGLRQSTGPLAWHDVNQAVLVPLPVLTGRTLDLAPSQPVEEVWLKLREGRRALEAAEVFRRVLETTQPAGTFTVVVPRELLAQRSRTQRTFSIVVGSVAVLALIVGGIGIMNIMLTSVVERTREIGVRRTAGATRRDVRLQFLVEALLMTLGGGIAGVVAGALASTAIAAWAGWPTHVSGLAIVLGVAVSLAVGLVFGLYPAVKAAALEPVDAMRYE